MTGSEQELMIGGGSEVNNRQTDTSQDDLDYLLHPNVLDTLADFDFTSDVRGPEPDAQVACLSGGLRKRAHSILSTLESMSPPQTSAVTPGLWEDHVSSSALQSLHTQHHTSSSDSRFEAGHSAGSVRHHKAVEAKNDAAESSRLPDYRMSSIGRGWNVPQRTPSLFLEPSTGAPAIETIKPKNSSAAENDLKEGHGSRSGKRKSPGVTGGNKRPLDPNRMERKANREKRRREEVNEKFEQLLSVLEEAEATSGLERPLPDQGQQLGGCINGRRVEVLSRTISVLRELLRDRLERSVKEAAGESICSGHGNWPFSQRRTKPDEQTALFPTRLSPVAKLASGSPSTQQGTHNDSAVEATPTPPTALSTGSSSCPIPPTTCSPPTSISAEPPATGARVATSATLLAAISAHHQHPHPGIFVPPGFVMSHHPSGMATSTELPAALGASRTPRAMDRLHTTPFFYPVPMYIPRGAEGAVVPREASGVHDTETCVTTAHPSGSVVPIAAFSATDARMPENSPGEDIPGAESRKVAWPPMPDGLCFPPTMLQMPQFVTQALSAADEDEKVTHAMCA